MSIILYSLCGAETARPFSPHCWKTVMALRHKGLDFVESPQAFTEIPKVEGGVSKIVPILKDGDTIVSDSFDIALYLEATYPDRPSLFGGEGGMVLSRFVESYGLTMLHMAVTKIAINDIHAMLGPVDQAYFRESREQRLGKPLEDFIATRDAEIAAFPEKFATLRHLLKRQAYLGGESPLFADYILFGALQWLRVTTGSIHLPSGDPVAGWFDRLLDLYDGHARKVA
ncbi:glutathione S-transferase family protein [Rhizobium halophytocola]|uniref:Glutathione S-transferase n=1 Tax=Rhizobium halophytocola TaxID=735519 RepID=A0ABS4DYH9_9HYPH|nr:glutathione S-transferase family protein [Rhizobium halophytocola]MBP1850735.1 glutathione S-transferase [Rhizobium halophytocola]